MEPTDESVGYYRPSAARTELNRTITVSVCENGFWLNLTYKLYECLDGSLALPEPPDKTLKTEVQRTSPPPALRH